MIDAHHHVWTLARGDYGWLRPESPIHRDYGLDDYRRVAPDTVGSILVQAAPTDAETRFMLDVAAASEGLVLGVVGWTELSGADAPDRVATLSQDKLIRGLRPMLQDIADVEHILRPELAAGLSAMVETGLRLDLLATPRHLALLPQLASRFPGLAAVLDHAGKPDIAGGAWPDWARDIARIARDTPWFCKLSGLVTEAGTAWRTDDLRRYVDHLLDCFGPTRLMWGSDWPVVDLAGGLPRWRAATETLLPADCREAVLGGNALRFYGISPAVGVSPTGVLPS